jgi:hypothetical protein
MKKYIDSLKTKSHAEKSSFAFVASAILTSIIAGIWLFALLKNPIEYFDLPKDNELQNMANTGSLFDVVKESFR